MIRDRCTALVIPMLIGLLAIGGATDRKHSDDPRPRPKVDPDQLRKAPETFDFEGRTITLKTDLWRNFMPGPGPRGRPLLVAITLKAKDGQPWPEGLDLDHATVTLLQGETVWTGSARKEPRPTPQDTLFLMVRDGPAWELDTRVDVILQLRDARDREHRIQAKQQRIERVS